MESCHQMAGSDRNGAGDENHSAPSSEGDCCAEGNSNSFRIEAQKSPLNPVAHTFWTAGSLASFQSLVATQPPQTEIDCLQSPYLRANPPLLI